MVAVGRRGDGEGIEDGGHPHASKDGWSGACLGEVLMRRARSDALPENQDLEHRGHPHSPAKDGWSGAGLGEVLVRRARSDALPENQDLEHGGHPHAPAKDGWSGAGLGEVLVRRARSDALPENTRYVDTGCDVHSNCLTCPLVRCRYDEPGGARRIRSRGRDQTIVARRRAGEGVEEIASRIGVSRRTVFRALARTRRGGR